MDEQVDILLPPLFTPTGEVKSRHQAYKDGDWIGTFNLWVFSRDPVPSVVYQQRSPDSKWAPNLLDVTAGGHLLAGEQLAQGLREVEEELGKKYELEQIKLLGKKLYVGFNADGTSHNNLVGVYMTEDNEPLNSYKLDKTEVYALCRCAITDLLKVHRDRSYHFKVTALTADGEEIEIDVNQASFPENWDNYHHKIALLAERYFRGETDLLY